MFKEALQKVFSSTDKVRLVALLGMDGIMIESCSDPDGTPFEIDLFSAEYSNLLKNINKTNTNIEFGDTREFLVRTDKYTIVINKIAEEYLIVSVIDKEGNLGRARYENNKAAITLEDSM